MTAPKSFIQWVVMLVIVIAILAIAYYAVQYFALPVPGIVWTILGIVLVAAVVILAIRFLWGLGGPPE